MRKNPYINKRYVYYTKKKQILTRNQDIKNIEAVTLSNFRDISMSVGNYPILPYLNLFEVNQKLSVRTCTYLIHICGIFT